MNDKLTLSGEAGRGLGAAPCSTKSITLKAISLWQPWASAMASGVKQIETRSWPTSHRGDLVICASKRKPSREEVGDDETYEAALAMPYGCAVCVVEVYDCWQTERITNLRQPISQAERDLGDYTPGRFGWLTRNCRKLRNPVPILGRQGLWMLPPESVALINTNLSNE
jgi:activating signal cointegrator 1